MAVDIGPKIGIDGEKEYRQQINNIINQAKTLSSEMKAVTSSFTKNTTEEEKATKQTEVLTKQIKVQEERVELLSDMLKRSAEETGDNSNETLKWQQAVNNATADLNNMNNKLTDLNSGLDETEEGMSDVGEETEEAGQKALSFGDIVKANVISDAIVKGFEALKSAVSGLANTFKDMAMESAFYADDIATMSTVTGLSTEALQEFTYMAELVDTDVSAITGSMTKLTKTMYNASTGNKTAVSTFKELGIAYKNADGTLRNTEDVFFDIIEVLGQMENPTERDALAMTVLGKSAKDLNPLIQTGAEGIEALRKEAHELGYVLDDEQLTSLLGVSDAYERWNRTMEMVRNTIGVGLAPVVEQLFTTLQEWVTGIDWEEIGAMLGETFEGIAESIRQIDIRDVIKGISEGIKSFIDMMSKINFIEIFNSISRTIEFVKENGQTIITIIGAVGTAIAGLKIASLISSLGGVAEAVKMLTNPIGIAIMAVTAITAIVLNFGTIMEKVKEIVGRVKEAISKSFETLKADVTDRVETMKEEVSEKWNTLKSNAEETFNNMKSYVSREVEVLKTDLIEKANRIKEAVTEKWNDLKSKTENLFTSMKSKTEETFGALKDKVASIFENMKTAISDKVTSIKDSVSNAVKGALDTVSDLVSNAWNWGSDLMDNLKSGIQSKIDALKNTAKNVANIIKSFLGFSEPEKGPLSNFHTFMPDMMELMAKGINDNAFMVEDALTNLTDSMAMAMENGNSETVNYGGVVVNVDAHGMDGRELVDQIEQELTVRMLRRKAVY